MSQVEKIRMRTRGLYESAVLRILPTVKGLRWSLARHYKLYERLARAAEKRGKWEEARNLRDEAWGLAKPDEAELQWWETREWRRRARDHFVQLPPYPSNREENEWWERDPLGRLVLTEPGKSIIRKGMREELDWRRARSMKLAELVIALFGALAALIGGYLGARAGR
jgi:hypothetical protein